MDELLDTWKPKRIVKRSASMNLIQGLSRFRHMDYISEYSIPNLNNWVALTLKKYYKLFIFLVFSLFLICPGDEKIYMRLGTYGRNPHEPAILIHPRIS